MKKETLCLKKVTPMLKSLSQDSDQMLITKPPQSKFSASNKSHSRGGSSIKSSAMPRIKSVEQKKAHILKTSEVPQRVNRPVTEDQKFEKLSREILTINDPEFIDYLRSLQKGGPPEKPTRFYKTKYRITKSNTNVDDLQKILCAYINRNKIKTANIQVFNLPDYERSAPFLVGTLDFIDKIVTDNKIIEDKFGYESKNLRRNNMVLEEVLLTRLEKRKNRPVKPNFNLPPPKIKGNIH